jgi:hypothetical protein
MKKNNKSEKEIAKIMSEFIKKYIWQEFAVLLPDNNMVRGEFININDVSAINEFRNKYNNTNIFASIQRFIAPDFDSAFIVPFFFDIDCPDNLSQAREDTLAMFDLLMDRTGVHQEQIQIFFSGNKGFHIIVPCEVFDAFEFDGIFNLYKKMAIRAIDIGIKNIDVSVYNHRRILRYPNSIHSKSGLYKIPLSYETLRDVSVEGIMEIAKQPQPQDYLTEPILCSKTAQWFRLAVSMLKNQSSNQDLKCKTDKRFPKGWRTLVCIKNMQESVLPDGVRHEAYMVLARYYAYLNMHHDEIKERLELIDARNPVNDNNCIERIVSFAVFHPGFAGCEHSIFKKYCNADNCFYAKLKKK